MASAFLVGPRLSELLLRRQPELPKTVYRIDVPDYGSGLGRAFACDFRFGTINRRRSGRGSPMELHPPETTTSSPRRIWRTVAIVLMVPALAALLYTGVIWNRYLDTLPRTPDQTSGRLYPRNIHGIVVFQTRAEALHLERMENISFGTFALGMLIGWLEERHWRRTAGKSIPPMPEGWQPK
jgi:hypothetical protein